MRALTALRMLYRALVRGDEQARYDLAERAARAFYPTYKFSEFGRTFLDDASFLARYEELEGSSNHHALDRKFALDQLVQLALPVPGDTAECGVFKGTSSYLICARTRDKGKPHHVFDSFAGLSEPGAEDGDYWERGNLSCGEDEVRARLAPFDFVELHPGWIPERFGDVADRRFSFVHVDVDLHQPTLDSIEFFYERLSPGGLLVCDDYGFRSCPGATRAMDEFFAERPEPIVHLPTGQGFVIRGAS